MRNKILAISMVAAASMVATPAMAEVGFQFRVPFQVTHSKDLNKATGTATLLTFDIDSATTVGILNENSTYTSAAAVASTLNLNALRIQKNVTDMVNVGMDFGNVVATSGNGTAADIFGGAKLLSSKGSKVASYLTAEVLYRFAKTPTENLGGVQLSLAAGVNF